MPFVPHTPESIIPRSDSKNPATTCKGITSSGRPCRRALAVSPQPSPSANRAARDGVLAVLPADDEDHEGAAAFFCWQHKEQADRLAADDGGRKAGVIQLKERTSVDSLVDRLGIMEIESNRVPRTHGKRNHNAKPARKETLPKRWQDVPGPLIAVTGNDPFSEKRPVKASSNRRSRREPNIIFSLSCCTASVEPRDVLPPPVKRHSYQNMGAESKTAKIPTSLQPTTASTPTPMQRRQNQALAQSPSSNTAPSRSALAVKPTTPLNRPLLSRDPSSQTQDLLALIPKTLAPQTTSLLLAELAKPISEHDDEGYIYIFWLTPSASPAPSAEATSSLLSPSTRLAPRSRRASAVEREHTTPTPIKPGSNTSILLKIGRASNVQRRMNEWSRQCNHTLSLLRYYPYHPSFSSPSPSPSHPSTNPPLPTPRKVPHAHKIERLIHLELGELRIKRSCATCGKEHREWFEVDGSSRHGVAGVDEVVRRWVEWGLGGKNGES